MLARQVDEQVLEVHAVDQQSQRRHEEVLHERGHDLPEGGAEDDGHREVQDVSAHHEGLEVLKHEILLAKPAL